MTVFKGFLKLVKQNMGMIITYMIIFITICVMVQMMTKGQGTASFEEQKLNVAVIDRDGGTLAKGLTEYLKERHHIVDIADDKTVIQEELFYRNIAYVVIIPEDFEEKCLNGAETLKTTRVPGTTSAFYVDQQIQTFINDVKVFVSAGYSSQEAMNQVEAIGKEETEVTLLDKNGHGGKEPPYAYMFQYMPYILLSLLCYIIGFIMIAYRKKDVRRRMLCSAVSSRNQNAQLVLGYVVIGVGFWAICMTLPFILYGKSFITDKNAIYYMINAFLVMLVSLAIAFLAGVIVEKEEVINAVVNVITLGMSFTCGVFVSLDMLSKGVRAVARFLPIYWYETVNRVIADNADFTSAQQMQIWRGYGIQLLFAAAILSVGLVISRQKERE